MSEELKPCPFCGSKNTSLEMFDSYGDECSGCLDCGAMGPRWMGNPNWESHNKGIGNLVGIDAWNTRKEPKQ